MSLTMIITLLSTGQPGLPGTEQELTVVSVHTTISGQLQPTGPRIAWLETTLRSIYRQIGRGISCKLTIPCNIASRVPNSASTRQWV